MAARSLMLRAMVGQFKSDGSAAERVTAKTLEEVAKQTALKASVKARGPVRELRVASLI